MTDQEIAELLPWYVNGTLDDSETREVEAYLERSPEARAELAELRVLEDAVTTLAEDEPAWKPGLLTDALRRIGVHEREQASATEAQFGARVRRFVERILPGLDVTPRVPRLALAVQLALVLGLGSALVLTQLREPDYGTLSGGSASVADRALVQVGFQSDVSEAELRALLRELDAEIVAGPSAQGLYTVGLPHTPDQSEEIEAGIRALRARSDVVRYAERRP